MTIGQVDFVNGDSLGPGQIGEALVTFLMWPGIVDEIYPGREWRIQEGPRLVGFGTVIEVLPSSSGPANSN
jgi:hypothetical protein